MERGEPHQVVNARIGRARACIATSRESISRSRERIDDSLRAITGVAGRFTLREPVLSDEQMQAATERDEMKTEQGTIDREVRWTRTNAAGREVWG